ncbi:MAG: hypothetical protein H6713_26065 [Myxococcales bacterium]|nr:hypothetical protein [Myxococcales bacterium]MCB9753422.1 hypothetical protein [Myxococcales bacterium]
MSWSPHSSPRAYGVEFTLAFALYLGLTNGLIIGLSLCYAVLPWYLSLPLRLAFVLGAPYLVVLALEEWARGFSRRMAVAPCMLVAAFAIFFLSGANYLSNYVWLARGDNVDGVTVANANEYPYASYMRLEGAEFRKDMALFHKWYGDEDTYYYWAVPIVDHAWKEGDSILVWAVYDDRTYWAMNRAPEDVPLQGFVESRHRDLRRTLRKHERALNPFAIALELSDLPYGAQLAYTWRGVRYMFWLVNGILVTIWFVLILKLGD